MASELEVERLVVRLVGNMADLQKTLDKADASIRSFTEKASSKLKSVGSSMRSVGRKLSLGVTTPLAGIGVASLASFAKFDQAMTQSTSIMDVTEDQIKAMRDQALALSTSSAQGPEELARSYFFLASAGKSAEQSMSLLPPLTKFATAGAFDMATATDLLTDAQSALGMASKDVATDTSNLIRLSDVLVKANTLSNATVQQFSESLTNTAGASLKTFGKSAEEGVAVLAAYADQGVKGAVAGTNLSRVMLLLSKSSRDSAEAHEKFGFSVFDSEGKMRNFADIIGNLEQVTSGMSDETKAATLEQLGFEARVQQAILPLLGSSKAIAEYQKKLESASGVTESVADKQMKSFSNQMKLLWNQVTVAAIKIGEELAPVVAKLASILGKGIGLWNQLNPAVRRIVVIVGAAVAAIGPLLIILGGISTVLGMVLPAIGTFIGLFMSMLGPILAVVAVVTLLGMVLFKWTNIGGQALNWFGKQWSRLMEFIRPAIEGIKNALKANDLTLAVKIAWAQIKLAWFTGIEPLRKMWAGFVYTMKVVWIEATHSIKSVWQDTVTGLSALMVEAGGALGLFGDVETDDILNTLAEDAERATKALAGTREQALKAAEEGLDESMAGIKDQIKALEKERNSLVETAAVKAMPTEALEAKLEEADVTLPEIKVPKQTLDLSPRIQVDAAATNSLEAFRRIAEFRAGSTFAPRNNNVRSANGTEGERTAKASEITNDLLKQLIDKEPIQIQPLGLKG